MVRLQITTRVPRGGGGADITTGLIYYYKFDTGDIDVNNKMYNYATSTNDMPVVTGASISTTTKIVGTGSLNVNNAGLYNSAASWTDSQNKSFSLWFYTTSLSGHKNGAQQPLRFNGTNVLFIYINDTSTTIHVSLNGGDIDTLLPVSINTWYHFVWTVSGVSGSATYKFYLNNGSPTTLTNQVNTSGTIRTGLYIGAGAGDMPITGYVDDFRIYNNVELNASQISALYNLKS